MVEREQAVRRFEHPRDQRVPNAVACQVEEARAAAGGTQRRRDRAAVARRRRTEAGDVYDGQRGVHDRILGGTSSDLKASYYRRRSTASTVSSEVPGERRRVRQAPRLIIRRSSQATPLRTEAGGAGSLPGIST